MSLTLFRKVVLFGCWLVPPFLWGGDWLGWRGPTGQGLTDDKNLPTTWSKEGENLLWKVPLPGNGKGDRRDLNQSSPIIVKNRVIITASFWPKGQDATQAIPEHHIVCYDLEKGALIWDIQAKPGPWLLKDLRGGYTAPTPASDGDRVYVVFGSSVLAAFDLEGKSLWRKEITPFDFDVALGASPVLVGDLIVLQCDGVRRTSRLLAFDKKTGNIVWERKRPHNDFCHSTPTLVQLGGKKQLLVAGSNSLEGVDPRDGSILWSFASKGDTVSPVMEGGLVYIDSGRGGPAFGIDPNGKGDITQTNQHWKINQVPEGLSSPVLFGDLLYRLHHPGMLSCRSGKDGSLHYAERLAGISTTSSPIITADGTLYLANAGKSYVIKPGPKLNILATMDLGDSAPSSPAVSNGKILLKGNQFLFCVGNKR